jgi:hypothetical protein
LGHEIDATVPIEIGRRESLCQEDTRDGRKKLAGPDSEIDLQVVVR